MIHGGARSLPVQHLSVRLPWHDTGWTGTVCRAPEQNICCMILTRIREARDDAAEEKVAGKPWTDLSADEWPPCREERGAAMNAKPYVLKSRHAYAKSSSLHAHFDENYFHLPAYSVSAVPFRWTRRDDAKKIAQSLSLDLDLGREPKLEFDTVWIQDIDNQSVVNRHPQGTTLRQIRQGHGTTPSPGSWDHRRGGKTQIRQGHGTTPSPGSWDRAQPRA